MLLILSYFYAFNQFKNLRVHFCLLLKVSYFFLLTYAFEIRTQFIKTDMIFEFTNGIIYNGYHVKTSPNIESILLQRSQILIEKSIYDHMRLKSKRKVLTVLKLEIAIWSLPAHICVVGIWNLISLNTIFSPFFCMLSHKKQGLRNLNIRPW